MDDHKEVHDMIMTEVREIKQDVKSLLALKYQIFGIVTGVSFIITLGYNVMLK